MWMAKLKFLCKDIYYIDLNNYLFYLITLFISIIFSIIWISLLSGKNNFFIQYFEYLMQKMFYGFKVKRKITHGMFINMFATLSGEGI